MKNIVKLLGIIALVAVIGFPFVSCDSGGGGSNSNTPNPGSGGDGIYLYLKEDTDTPGNFYSIVEFTGNLSQISSDDLQIKIDGTAATILGNMYLGNSTRDVLLITPKFVVGQSYAVEITYTGSNSSLASKFPYSATLTCKKG